MYNEQNNPNSCTQTSSAGKKYAQMQGNPSAASTGNSMGVMQGALQAANIYSSMGASAPGSGIGGGNVSGSASISPNVWSQKNGAQSNPFDKLSAKQQIAHADKIANYQMGMRGHDVSLARQDNAYDIARNRDYSNEIMNRDNIAAGVQKTAMGNNNQSPFGWDAMGSNEGLFQYAS